MKRKLRWHSRDLLASTLLSFLCRTKSMFAEAMTMRDWRPSNKECSVNSRKPLQCSIQTTQMTASCNVMPSVSFIKVYDVNKAATNRHLNVDLVHHFPFRCWEKLSTEVFLFIIIEWKSKIVIVSWVVWALDYRGAFLWNEGHP